jgi:hypothetical protein
VSCVHATRAPSVPRLAQRLRYSSQRAAAISVGPRL